MIRDWRIIGVRRAQMVSRHNINPETDSLPLVYDYLLSGNCFKVRLLLYQLGIAYRRVHLDILRGESRTPEMLRINPVGRLPLVRLRSGDYLVESHAILFWFGQDSHLYPDDSWKRAKIWQWLCFEQHHLEPNLGTVRYWRHLQGKTRQELGVLHDTKVEAGYQGLTFLENHLTGRHFLVGDSYTLADLSLFAYTHVAEEGGFELSRFPNVMGWLDRVRQQPDWFPMEQDPPPIER